MKKNLVFITLLLLLTAAGACRKHNSANEQRYDLTGKVVAVERDKHLVTIAHQDVKNLMPAMTMPFSLPDEATLGYIAAGDEVTATLVIDGSSTWLENVTITRQSPDTSATTGVPEAKEGDEVPSYTLVNQDGKDIRLGNFRGKALMLTFIYTRCPLPEYCNLMSTNFAEVDRQLEKQPDLYARTHLLSITIDPDYDTPKVLRSYGAAHTERYENETFAHWDFATGTKDQIKGVAQFFGLRYFQGSDQIVHSLRTVIINPDGKVVKVYRDNSWKPEEAVAEMAKAATGGK
ncbi:MAG TPA: SCO family protein [Pyrinomonadaceae bacterium]